MLSDVKGETHHCKRDLSPSVCFARKERKENCCGMKILKGNTNLLYIEEISVIYVAIITQEKLTVKKNYKKQDLMTTSRKNSLKFFLQ